MKVSSQKDGYTIKIFIDGILHIFVCDRIVSLQSWNMEDKLWCIELQTKDNKILLEYDRFCKFLKVLEELHKLL